MQVLQTLRRRATIVAVLAAWAGGLAVGGLFLAGKEVFYVLAPTEPTAYSRSQVLLDAHDCWTQETPPEMQGKVPGHVVVTTPQGDIVYGGARLVGKAFAQLFEGKHAGLTIWGFCR